MQLNLHKKLAKNFRYAIIDYIPLELGIDSSLHEALLFNNKIMSNIFALDAKSLLNAVAIAIVMGIGAAIAYVLQVGDLFSIDLHSLTNVFGLAALGGVGSLITSFLTTSKGDFVGAMPIK